MVFLIIHPSDLFGDYLTESVKNNDMAVDTNLRADVYSVEKVDRFNGSKKESLYTGETIYSLKAFEKLGWLYFDCMLFQKAEKAFLPFVQGSVSTSDSFGEGRGSIGLALTCLRMNNYKDAQVWFERAVKVIPWPRGPSIMALLKMIESELSFYRERQVAGIQLATEALSIASYSGDKGLEKRILILIGDKGPSGTKRAMLLRALLIEDNESAFLDVTCRVLLASFERTIGETEKALSRLVEVSEHLQPGLSDKLIFVARKEEGEIRWILKRKAGAIRSFVLARNSAERLGNIYDFGDVTLSLAECCVANNMAKKAKAYLKEAIDKIESVSVDELESEVEKDRIIKLLFKLKSYEDEVEK
jgi:tetratricopeptide (TPR) repeat protein